MLGVLALLGPRCPDQLRVFLLALAIVDDIGAVLAIALFYTDEVDLLALFVAVVLLAGLLALRWVRFWRTPFYAVVGILCWVAVLRSGVHPSVVGVALGLLVNAYAPRRTEMVEAVRIGKNFLLDPTRSGPAPPARSRSPPSRRTSGCSRRSSRGAATSSCRCSCSPTPAWCSRRRPCPPRRPRC